MIEPYNSVYFSPSKEFRRLSLLLLIKDNAQISQHLLAEKSHLSSSMVNIYIKELTRDGLITASGHSNRTFRYYLTDIGRKFLDRHFLKFSAETIQLYAAVKREIVTLLKQFEAKNIKTLVLYGASDTAEIVNDAIKNTGMNVVGIVDSDTGKHGRFFNNALIQSPETITDISPDAVLITSFAYQNEIYETIKNLIPSGIHILKLANI